MSSTETRNRLLFRLFLVGTGKRVTASENTRKPSEATGDHIHASFLSPQRSMGSATRSLLTSRRRFTIYDLLLLVAGRFVLGVTGKLLEFLMRSHTALLTGISERQFTIYDLRDCPGNYMTCGREVRAPRLVQSKQLTRIGVATECHPSNASQILRACSSPPS
jgi:hypothetical protein